MCEITNKFSGTDAYFYIYHLAFENSCLDSAVNLEIGSHLHEKTTWLMIWRSRIKLLLPFYLSLLGLVISPPWISGLSFENWGGNDNIYSPIHKDVMIKWENVCGTLCILKSVTKFYVGNCNDERPPRSIWTLQRSS